MTTHVTLPGRPSGAAVAYLLLVTGTAVALVVVTWVLLKEPTAYVTAWVLIGIEAPLALASLHWLEGVAAGEWAAARPVTTAAEGAKAIDGATEALQAAYSTASNALIVLGMLGAAGQLLFYSATARAEELATLAPRAFSATAFGLWCGVVVAVRGQYVATLFRRTFASRIRTDQLAGQASVDVREAFGRLTASIEQLGRQLDAAVADGSAREILVVANRQAEDLHALREHLLPMVTRELQLHDLQKEAFEKVVVGLGGKRNRTITAQLAEVSSTVDRLHEGLEGMRESLGAATVSQDGLRDALTEQSRSLLANHAQLLSEETRLLAKVALESLLQAAKATVTDRLDELAGDFERKIAGVYDSAYDQASRHLNEKLAEALSQTGNLGAQLTGVVALLSDATMRVQNLARALEQGGKTAEESHNLFLGAVAGAQQATEGLARLLATPPPDGSTQPLANTLGTVCEVLASVLESLRATLDEVNRRQALLAQARDILAQRFQS